jgi:hypothetical protein
MGAGYHASHNRRRHPIRMQETAALLERAQLSPYTHDNFFLKIVETIGYTIVDATTGGRRSKA